MKHTPGTWIACEDDEREGMPFIPIVAGTETEPYLVAQVEPDMDEATQEFYISERTRADAQLIAAAPDLAAALKLLVAAIPDRMHNYLYAELEMAVKALKKGGM